MSIWMRCFGPFAIFGSRPLTLLLVKGTRKATWRLRRRLVLDLILERMLRKGVRGADLRCLLVYMEAGCVRFSVLEVQVTIFHGHTENSLVIANELQLRFREGCKKEKIVRRVHHFERPVPEEMILGKCPGVLALLVMCRGEIMSMSAFFCTFYRIFPE